MAIKQSITELIGNTPLLELVNFKKANNLNAKIVAKLEYFNPAGSVKDRVANAMIADAEAKGVLKPGATIIEPTSGNTGIGLAAVGSAKKQPLVESINHASLNPKYQDLYNKYFPNGAGSIFTFNIKGGEKEAKKFIDSLQIFSILANVADVKSLVIHPATTTHS